MKAAELAAAAVRVMAGGESAASGRKSAVQEPVWGRLGRSDLGASALRRLHEQPGEGSAAIVVSVLADDLRADADLRARLDAALPVAAALCGMAVPAVVYTLVAGRWIARPGEAAVPSPFLTATGTRIGDTLTLGGLGAPVTVWIVGEVLDPRNDGMQVFTDAATLKAAHPDLTETSHHTAVARGTDVHTYAEALDKPLKPLGATARAGGLGAGGDMVATLDALSAILTLMLVAVAALGVLLPAGWAARTRTAVALRTE
ncbi:hypothetical protein ACIQZN_21885 [Streptomyces sp. NPDC097595]|uniref:hypothetical protein n=1 Tax=Streptomyces sp. NPDC097595 TaxID=3366090 RepID=UPI003808FC5D